MLKFPLFLCWKRAELNWSCRDLQMRVSKDVALGEGMQKTKIIIFLSEWNH